MTKGGQSTSPTVTALSQTGARVSDYSRGGGDCQEDGEQEKHGEEGRHGEMRAGTGACPYR
jgi:hypothetical protein